MDTIVNDTAAQRPAHTPATATVRTPALSETTTAPRRPGFWSKLGSAFAMFRNRKSIAGLSILGFFVLVAIFADVLAPYSPTKVDNTARFQPPREAMMMVAAGRKPWWITSPMNSHDHSGATPTPYAFPMGNQPSVTENTEMASSPSQQ